MLHFLLGGYDLEMIEIRNLLEENNFLFSDKNLSWGASVDNYSDVILAHPLHHFVGVELAVRNPSLLPKYYIEIDHHNDKVNLPYCATFEIKIGMNTSDSNANGL